MKIHKMILTLLSVILLTNFTSSIVRAEALDNLGLVVDGSLLTNKLEVEDTTMKLVRGNILNKGTAKCTNAGDGKVTATGLTIAHVICDNLYLSLSLDKYNPEDQTWSSFKTWSVSEQETSSLLKSYTIDVDRGYFYRVRGNHAAEDGETYESVETCTDGILIK
ncbi:hypothetical protein GKG47_00185 [Lactonifactor sp. BIOML-A3]|uniref:DUF6147 family protein n=1 Tax=unclassified Lactonifactor TaxID=2636670 RepID=UPI0012AFD93C|nr:MULTISPECIES: DUF6147 family protein [unclassified Lactonifactor]MSA00015.1 hypothetical protein [Lactonifactor sp. BIOML-A5]MSA06642.1 hypothetical protein [Lactonifactor sp. BIOML-A4]MSA10860.1 hypothetical protein [Lactonifactor sp. BIOML-A3]MSA15874.1 hypothetical protein [Lactonifactor sp. BIOML-A2]MSA36478.1 hypothetical protein [Lactonifactor sp. BIOML-A1]